MNKFGQRWVMTKRILSTFIFLTYLTNFSVGQSIAVDTVLVQSGNLKLRGLLWHPYGKGPFPAVIFCHGAYETNDTTYDLVENMSTIGVVFANHGYMFLGLCRRGIGLSKSQGKNSADLMADAYKEKGQDARNRVQLEHLQSDQLDDMISGLRFLRNRKDVDTERMVVTGHSFGGSLALLVAAHEPGLKAAVVFSAAGFSWDRSPALRKRLLQALARTNMPVMIVQARNDYSLSPGLSMDSALTVMKKAHSFKLYPEFRSTNREGHNLVFLGTEIWEKDVFGFLDQLLKH